MTINNAFGRPGIQPRWTRGNKDAIGTAYSAASRIWFTLSAGVLNEVYFPTIDRPQTRDLQYLITDGETFFHDERHLQTTIGELAPHALGYEVANADREQRYKLNKQVITDPHHACLLIHTRLEADKTIRNKLRVFALLAPHLDVGGWGNCGKVAEVAGRRILLANKNGIWLAMAATIPFSRCSCGYVGASDGWTDLANNFKLDWSFESATDGNIALTAELDTQRSHKWTLGLAFGFQRHSAITTLLQSLSVPFSQHREKFVEQWDRACRECRPLKTPEPASERLYQISHSLLLAHEDKTYPGAMIASLSIPWGEARGDDDIGGYHLVWTRDLVNSALGLLACGHTATAQRALIYIACSQQPDGGFYQNFWIDGDPYWQGIQLDEVAFPIMLAWRLREADALGDFDPYPMVLRAAGYLVQQGPATPQERWEENSGYSPSTLATNIAGLTCAACFARERGDQQTADFIQQYADFLESHIETWTVTTAGTLLPDVSRHFIRINPISVHDVTPDENPNTGTLFIKNQAPGQRSDYPAKEIVDAGFLELVRYGIRSAGDPLFKDSLKVIDAYLKVAMPHGPCWRRYNHDGYGQREDGGPFDGWGQGRAWPLLTGERGHYELAAGRDVAPYLRAMESFASCSGLLPEQVWDEPSRPDLHLFLGQQTGSATPLMWAHAEYIKLLRSAHDGVVFDRIAAVVDRYLGQRVAAPLEIWKFNRQINKIDPGTILRIQAADSFRLRWTKDDWQTANDAQSTATAIGTDFVDIEVNAGQQSPIRFTFFWPNEDRWEGKDYDVESYGERNASGRRPYPEEAGG